MFDCFVAELRCPRCGERSRADATTQLQTHIRSDADGAELAVGHSFDPADLRSAHLQDAGYSLIEVPAPGAPIRLLDVWICPACQTEQWARIDIAEQCIVGIEAVNLDRATLESAHFISEVNAEQWAAGLLGCAPYELAQSQADSVAILRQKLV